MGRLPEGARGLGLPWFIRVVDLRIPGVDKIIAPTPSREISRITPLDANGMRYLVEFAEGEFQGELSVNYLSKDGTLWQRVITVKRVGKLPEPIDREAGK
jgi:hypothetical protein